MKTSTFLLGSIFFFLVARLSAQPNWPAIKSNATFVVYDTSYAPPYIQPINVSGWEDGLNITRDGLHLYSTYLPVDALSWTNELQVNPYCLNFDPYYRAPLLGIDTVTNVYGCPNYMQSDIIIASRTSTTQAFNPWTFSNLRTSFSFEGAADGALLNPDTFDVFVFTKDGPGTQNTDVMFMRKVPVDPFVTTAVPILSTLAQEDNPHIERLNDSTLLILFDRARSIYYSFSYDNGTTWQTAALIQNVLNDQAPYDVQPHLFNDGTSWWVYFCADNANGVRGIYKSKQLIANNWDSWGPKQVVIEPGPITGNYGTTFGIGEPTLTKWGDLSFVVIYGKTGLADTTDVFDCDPWFLPKKRYILTGIEELGRTNGGWSLQTNPVTNELLINYKDAGINYFIWIYNSEGSLVKPTEVLRPWIDVSDLSPGLYFLKSSNLQYKPLKFIKE